jgi:hypothetical protein
MGELVHLVEAQPAPMVDRLRRMASTDPVVRGFSVYCDECRKLYARGELGREVVELADVVDIFGDGFCAAHAERLLGIGETA